MLTSSPRPLLRPLLAALTVVLVAGLGLTVMASPAAAAKADEIALYNATNASRTSAGLAALQYDPLASTVAAHWAAHLASVGTLSHNPSLADQVSTQVTSQWTRLGENVGVAGSIDSVHAAYMGSTGHRANILGDYNRVGVGTARDASGRVWTTVVFVKGPAIAAVSPATDPVPAAPVQWHLRNAAGGGAPDASFAYGGPGNQILSCDWDGNGTDTIGIFSNGNWYLRNSNNGGAPDLSFAYGTTGYLPVCGDWDGNGTETIGVYAGGMWHLRNSNSPGGPNTSFAYGTNGYIPVVGNWDGAGGDGIGVYVNGTWHLRNNATAGGPDVSFAYGTAGYRPVVGNWDGTGGDGVGVYVNGSWFLRNPASAGAPSASFSYGAAGYTPVAGNWDGTGGDGVGVVVGNG